MSSSDKSVSYDALQNLFVSLGCFNSPSELHGLLVGVLATGQRLDTDAWIELIQEHMALAQVSDSAQNQFVNLYRVNLAALESTMLEFQLLLPDDESSMAERAEALGIWCHGFLSGFSLANAVVINQASEDVKELINDLAQISEIEFDIEDSEESEMNFFEVVEFVKIAAMTVFADCNQAGDKAPPVLH